MIPFYYLLQFSDTARAKSISKRRLWSEEDDDDSVGHSMSPWLNLNGGSSNDDTYLAAGFGNKLDHIEEESGRGHSGKKKEDGKECYTLITEICLKKILG
jgi:hypothetical protein